MFVVRHRLDGLFFAGICNATPMWSTAIAWAYRFQSPEDAFTTTYIVCLSTDPSDLVVEPAPSLVFVRAFS